MRITTTMPIVGGILMCGLALAACGSNDTAAAPNASAPATSAVTSTTTTSSPAKTTSSPTTRPPVQSHVLGPNGYGKIKMGMSFAQVKAAGVLQENEQPEPYCHQYKLFTDGKLDGFIYITKERGVEIIAPDQKVSTPEGMTLGAAVEELERQMIAEALRRSAGNIARAAKELGLSRKGLYLKMGRLDFKI